MNLSQEELVALLSEPFRAQFADLFAARVRAADALDALYAVAVSPHEGMAEEKRHKVLFRSAYVLDRIYFADPASFAPFAASFCRRDFPSCADASARRHFTRIMAHLLGRFDPPSEQLDRIACAAAEWAVDPAARVAVRIGAVEVLKACRGRVDWVDDVWEDLLETMALGATPGIESRMRKTWRKA